MGILERVYLGMALDWDEDIEKKGNYKRYVTLKRLLRSCGTSGYFF